MGTDKRWCFYVDATMQTPRGVIPSVVTEDEPGYSPMIGQGEQSQPWYWGSIEQAKAIAEEENAKRGLTPQDAHDIVASSIAASIARDARVEEARERYDSLRRG